MEKTVIAFNKEVWRITWKGIKQNFVIYFVLLSISLVALATIILAPMAIRVLVGMHEMLIVEGKIDYRKLLSQADDDKNYFKVLLVIIVELVAIAGGTIMFIVPGIVIALSLVPVNYLLYKKMNPSISALVTTSVETMRGQKTRLFLSLLIPSLGFGIIYAVLGVGIYLLNLVSIFLTIPLLLVVIAVSLFAMMYFFIMLVAFARNVCEKPAQPTLTA
ncbi:MAG: hypothetical protein WC479_01035 [Candidatus Izemoplasmatales bacterium]|jgi:hypothetical protein|nr:hypothetical protein [Candidatus Izemoplasmatales bacterium]MDD3865486.1 hypothetical protein [Candidatus Izemoplasmatales bacterium]